MRYKLNIAGIPFDEGTWSYNYDGPEGTTFQLLERHDEDPGDNYIVVFIAAPEEPN